MHTDTYVYVERYREVLEERRDNLKALSDSVGVPLTMDVPDRTGLTLWAQ